MGTQLVNNKPVISVGGAGASGGLTILSTTTNIDAKVTGTTNLYTVPTGKVAIVVSALIRCTAISGGLVTSLGLGVGVASGEDDIFSSTTLTGLNAANEAYELTHSLGAFVVAQAGEVIKLGIDTAAVPTTMTIAVDLIGYLL